MTDKPAKKLTTVQIAAQLAEPVLGKLGLELWDVRFVKEGATWYLRYFIDTPDGVNIQQCTDFSRAVEVELDAVDPIPQSYVLEVCSPGIERELRLDSHFERYIGHEVTVKLIRPIEGQRNFIGTLTAKNGDDIHILLKSDEQQSQDPSLCDEDDDQFEMVFTLKETVYVKLYVEF